MPAERVSARAGTQGSGMIERCSCRCWVPDIPLARNSA